jgi:hypothetical protein
MSYATDESMAIADDHEIVGFPIFHQQKQQQQQQYNSTNPT